MSTWSVINRATGILEYAYSSDVAVDWPQYPFAQYNHIAAVEIVSPTPQRRVTKLDFIARLGSDFDTLFAASKTVLDVEKFMKMLDWATPEADGTSIDLDDPRTVGALQAFEAAGLLAAGRAAEVVA